MVRALLVALIGLTSLFACGRARAQGFIIPEIGARKNGMGTAVGRVDDLSAIYHNPAALALLSGTRVGLSFTAAFLKTDIRLAPWPGSDKYITAPVDGDGYYPRQTPGVVAPVPFIGASSNVLSDKLVAAVGVYFPNAAGASFGEGEPSRYHIIDAYVVSAFFTGAVAYRPWRWLAVGGGVSAVYIRVKRRALLFPTIEGRDLSVVLGGETEIELEGDDLEPAFSLGVQLWPHETVSLGLMMLSRYDVSLEGPLTLRPGKDALPTLATNPRFTDNQHRTEVVAPWIFGFGANWDVTPWLEIGAELRLYLNSLVQQQVTTITNDGPLKELLPNGFVTPKNLHNSVHVGGGVKIRPPLDLDLDLLAGVHYENSASPDNTVEVSAPSFDLLGLHIGGRWRFAERYALTLIYSHYRYLERTTTDSLTTPPTNFTGSAYNHQLSLVFEARIADGIAMRR